MTRDDAERYARVSSIVGGAYGLRGRDLETYLDAACGDDSAIRARVAALLAVAGDEDETAALAEPQLNSRRALLDVAACWGYE